MLTFIVYLFFLFLELFFLAGFSVFTTFLIYSSIKGSPYVPTKKKQVKLILEKAKLKKDQVFLELGCGDGRMVRMAVKNYRVKGIGIEINPLLFFWNKFLNRLYKISNPVFFRLDISRQILPRADIIYLFLMPKLIVTITSKLKIQLDRGSLIISHGFKVEGFKKYLRYKIDEKPFPTYFYKL